MTKTEIRALYVIHVKGDRAMQQQVSQAMARTPGAERTQALRSLEAIGLIGSARVPATKHRGPDGMLYWLTPAGRETVADLLARGEIKTRTRTNRAKEEPDGQD